MEDTLRALLIVLATLVFVRSAEAQTPPAPQGSAAVDRDALIARILSSGDGRGPESAFVVARGTEAYLVIQHLQMPFLRQRSVEERSSVLDVLTVRGAEGGEQEVFFRAPAPDDLPAEQRQTERNARAILTSGDGLTPATAFIVGGAIGAEYAILRMMGLRRGLQGLVTRDGCHYDLQRATDPATGEVREIWFRLGGSGSGGLIDYSGRCEAPRN